MHKKFEFYSKIYIIYWLFYLDKNIMKLYSEDSFEEYYQFNDFFSKLKEENDIGLINVIQSTNLTLEVIQKSTEQLLYILHFLSEKLENQKDLIKQLLESIEDVNNENYTFVSENLIKLFILYENIYNNKKITRKALIENFEKWLIEIWIDRKQIFREKDIEEFKNSFYIKNLNKFKVWVYDIKPNEKNKIHFLNSILSNFLNDAIVGYFNNNQIWDEFLDLRNFINNILLLDINFRNSLAIADSLFLFNLAKEWKINTFFEWYKKWYFDLLSQVMVRFSPRRPLTKIELIFDELINENTSENLNKDEKDKISNYIINIKKIISELWSEYWNWLIKQNLDSIDSTIEFEEYYLAEKILTEDQIDRIKFKISKLKQTKNILLDNFRDINKK